MKRRASWVAAAAIVGSLGVVAPAVPAQSGEGGCSAPYAPWFVQYTDALGVGDSGGPVLGASLDHHLLGVASHGSGWDMDLDGVPDEVTWEGDAMVISRGDGVVRLQPPAGARTQVGLGFGVGDLDGDGRPEYTATADGHIEGGSGDWSDYLVLGTIEPGTYRLNEVAVDVTTGGGGGVGDQDGDGLDDLVQGDLDGSNVRVVSGLDVLASGPGGAQPTDLRPIRTLPNGFAGVLDLGEGAPVLAGAGSLTDATKVVLHRAEPTELAVPPFEYGGVPNGTVTARQWNGDRIVVLHQSVREAGRDVMWNLDAPCTTFSRTADASGPARAEPAAATDGSARYTG